MSARPRDTRDTADPAARDDDPARRSSQPGDDPPANPQAAGERGGRPRAARERDLLFGLLPAIVLSLAAHAAVLDVLAHLHFGGGDSDPGLSLRGTGARGAPGGDDDGIMITLRRRGGSAPASETASQQREVVVQAQPLVMAPAEAAPPKSPVAPPVAQAPVATEMPPSTTAVIEPPAPREVTSVPVFAAAPATSAVAAPPVAPSAPVAEHEPVATLGEWEGPPQPASLSPEGSASDASIVMALAALGAAGRGQGGPGDGSGVGTGDASQGGGHGAGAGSGVGNGPGGNNGNGVLAPSPLAGNEPPDYPIDSRRAGEEGIVLVHAHIAADGRVTAAAVKTSSGFDRLDRAALDAVSLWDFEPARRAGQAVAQDVDIPIHFYLHPR